MTIYNILQVVGNFLGFTLGLYYSGFGEEILKCRVIDLANSDRRDEILYMLCYIYFISKFIDYLDTGFIILRKKFKNLSFLHVTHHFLVPIGTYAALKFYPHTNAGVVPLLNSFVHVFMYSYYLYAAHRPPQKKNQIKWKKCITQMQILQFSLYVIQGLYFLFRPSCTWPKFFSTVQVLQGVFFVTLFALFYKNNYRKNQINETKPEMTRLEDKV